MITNFRINSQTLYKDSDVIQKGRYEYKKYLFGIRIYKRVQTEDNVFSEDDFEEEKKIGFKKK